MSDDFVRDLEDELVAAARFRAAHPARRVAWPQRRLLLSALVAGAAAAVVVAAVLALVRGGEERIGGEPALPLGGECTEVAPKLRDRVTALDEPAQPGVQPPRAVLDALGAANEPLSAVVLDGARRWGGSDGVDFWVVPVVPRGASGCLPATHVCVVGVSGSDADALCGSGPDPGAVQWRRSPLPGGRSAIFGLVPDRATSVKVDVGDRSAEVEARLNVFGGVLPFPVRDGDGARPEVVYAPVSGTSHVGVVAAGGDADVVAYRLAEAGYETAGVTPGVTQQKPTTVYWRPGRVSREDVARIAALVGADRREEIADRERTPRPVQDADASVVVVVGSG